MHWRLLIEEFGPELHCLPGKKNIVADCLSRLEYDKDDVTPDNFTLKKEDINEYPLSYKIIMKYQQKDKALLKKAKNDNTYKLRTFNTAGRTRTLITKDNKIAIPLALQEPIVHWYHKQLCHPGQTQTELIVHQYFIWDRLSMAFKKFCSACHTCQLTKRRKVKYGHLPAKEAKVKP